MQKSENSIEENLRLSGIHDDEVNDVIAKIKRQVVHVLTNQLDIETIASGPEHGICLPFMWDKEGPADELNDLNMVHSLPLNVAWNIGMLEKRVGSFPMLESCGNITSTYTELAEILELFVLTDMVNKDSRTLFMQADNVTFYALNIVTLEDSCTLYFLFCHDTVSEVNKGYKLFALFATPDPISGSVDKTRWHNTTLEAAERYKATQKPTKNALSEPKETEYWDMYDEEIEESQDNVESDSASGDDYWQQYDNDEEREKQQSILDEKREEQEREDRTYKNSSAEKEFSVLAEKALSKLYDLAQEQGISAEKCENIMIRQIVQLTREKSPNWQS